MLWTSDPYPALTYTAFIFYLPLTSSISLEHLGETSEVSCRSSPWPNIYIICFLIFRSWEAHLYFLSLNVSIRYLLTFKSHSAGIQKSWPSCSLQDCAYRRGGFQVQRPPVQHIHFSVTLEKVSRWHKVGIVATNSAGKVAVVKQWEVTLEPN